MKRCTQCRRQTPHTHRKAPTMLPRTPGDAFKKERDEGTTPSPARGTRAFAQRKITVKDGKGPRQGLQEGDRRPAKAPPLSWPPPTAKGFPRSRPHPIHPAKAWPGERTQPEKALDFIEAGTPGDGAPRPTVVDVHRDLAARTAEVADHQHPRPSPAEEATPSTPPEAAAPASTHRAHPIKTRRTTHIAATRETTPRAPKPGDEAGPRRPDPGGSGDPRPTSRQRGAGPDPGPSRPDLAVGPSQETPTPDRERG